MKKFILFAAILFSAVSFVKADGTDASSTTSEGETKLTVKLMPIQTITINQSSVELLYDSEDKYKTGVTLTQNDHFKVYSTGGFTVGVKSAEDVLTGVGVGNTENKISAKTITVQASKGTGSTDLNIGTPSSVALSEGGNTLFTSDKGGADLQFNVEYVGAALNKYFDKLFNKGKPSVFKTDVIYTITPL